MSHDHRNVRSRNANWKGGISREYSQSLRPEIIKRDGERCSKCGTTEKKLDVHHLNGNHEDNTLKNLRLLCRPCHNKTHGKGSSLAVRNSANTRKLPDVTCAICGNTFRPRTSTTQYCSRPCQAKAHSAAMMKLEPRACDHCGAQFQPRRSTSRFCSQKCFGADWSARHYLREQSQAPVAPDRAK
jgi:hypothetical protein